MGLPGASARAGQWPLSSADRARAHASLTLTALCLTCDSAQGYALGKHADPVSQTWRTKQLEYAWVRSLSGQYVDFWECTIAALNFEVVFRTSTVSPTCKKPGASSTLSTTSRPFFR